jgi:hypothetical protein
MPSRAAAPKIPQFFLSVKSIFVFRRLSGRRYLRAYKAQKSYIFIEHSGRVWYNYNRPKKGRNLAENRTSRAGRPSQI